MIKSRHHAREIALQIIYQFDGQAAEAPEQTIDGTANSAELIQNLQKHFDHFRVPEELREFAAQLVVGSVQNRAELDQVIETHAQNWKVARMALIDRNLLRMAIYELKNHLDIPATATINEAVELAKDFGTKDSAAFVNGILDSVKKSLSRE